MIAVVFCVIALLISAALVNWYAVQVARKKPVSPIGPLAAWLGLLLIHGTVLAHLAGVL